MTHLPEIWNCIRINMPINKWISLEKIYQIVEIHLILYDEDFLPQSPTSPKPKWKRNVRNVLQSHKKKGEIEWKRNAQYMLLIRNFNFYQSLKEYCKTALSNLNKINLSNCFGYDFSEKLELLIIGRESIDYISRTEWRIIINDIVFNLMDSGVYHNVANAMKEDEIIARHLNKWVGQDTTRMKVRINEYLCSALSSLLHMQQSLQFHDDIFNKVFNKIENYFYENTVEFRYFSTILGFKMESEKLELSSMFSIIKISEEEKIRLQKEIEPTTPVFWGVPNIYDFAFEFYSEVEKVFDRLPANSQKTSENIVSNKFNAVITTLRLFKKGYVGYNYISKQNISWLPESGKSVIINPPHKLFLDIAYHLSDKESEDFLKFWETCQKVRMVEPSKKNKLPNKIDIALRRFNLGIEEKLYEDKLIDFVISLEALLLGDIRNELSYRFALRGAALLANSADEKKEIYEYLKSAYTERSKIVHGGKINKFVDIDKEKVLFFEFVNRIEDYLRLAIKKFIELLIDKKSHTDVFEDLDKKIISGKMQ